MKPPQRRRGRAAGLEERTTTLRNRGGLEAKGWSLWSWGERAGKGLDNKIQSLAIKYKHAVPTVEKGRRGGIREDRLSWGGAVGSYPTLPCTPPIQTPSLCVCGCVCVVCVSVWAVSISVSFSGEGFTELPFVGPPPRDWIATLVNIPSLSFKQFLLQTPPGILLNFSLTQHGFSHAEHSSKYLTRRKKEKKKERKKIY